MSWFKKIIPPYPVILLFFLLLVFIVLRDVFSSYFEADEWFHFTHYLPLSNDPMGFWYTILSTFLDTGPLSQGQHVVPVGEEIFYLNTVFFGTHFAPYAFMSLFFHALNSYLIFYFIKLLLLEKEKQVKATVIALVGGIFFALSATPIHAVTWAAFYGQNVLSVTLFLFSIVFFKKAFISQKRKYLFLSLIFLFLDLLTKETATALFLVLPFMALLEKKTFPTKFLIKIGIISVLIFISFRFVIPQSIHTFGRFIPSIASQMTLNQKQAKSNSAIGVTNTDASLQKNIYGEILFRTIMFPFKMTTGIFIPRETVHNFLGFITPIVYPLPPDIDANKSQSWQFFKDGPGNDLMVYLISIVIFVILICAMRRYYKSKQWVYLNALAIGLAIIVFTTLPLVLIVLSFPKWGYDTYFDLRHYYMPSVGGAIIFPLALLIIGEYFSSFIRLVARISIPALLISVLIGGGWFINNMQLLSERIHLFTIVLGKPQREIITQLKEQLPVLPTKAVFSIQTDGLGAFGPVVPFSISFPQILSVVYYDKSPLSDSFFSTNPFGGKQEGYAFMNGRGLGYFGSKKALSEALLAKKFQVNDIYTFYYDSQNIKLSQTTPEVRREMQQYLKKKSSENTWQVYNATTSAETITFSYPTNTIIKDVPILAEDTKLVKDMLISNNINDASLKVIRVSPTFDYSESTNIFSKANNIKPPRAKQASFDEYHVADVLVATTSAETVYFMKKNDLLLTLTTANADQEFLNIMEKLLGSISVKVN